MSSRDKKRKTTATAKKPSLKNKKKKTPTPTLVLPPAPQSTQTPTLPDDLVVSCLARVSRLHYAALSLASKSFRSLLASPELYETRSSLGRTESCLYVCLQFPDEPKYRWFTLCRRPVGTLNAKKKKKSSGYVLAKIPTPHSGPYHEWSGLVTIGSDIYNIVGDGYPSSSVLILDSRSNTWRQGPSMLVKRIYPHASVLDGKIYVAGGCSSPSTWMEVFDPKTQTWEFVSNPGAEIRGSDYISKSAGVDSKVYIFGNSDGLAYEPREDRWERVGEVMGVGWPWYSYSVIDKVLYSYHESYFKWYDTTARSWKILKGLNGMPKRFRCCPTLADYGGKMVVLLESRDGSLKKMISCAVIALERRNDEEIWGTVEWYDTVLTALPESCLVECALATTV